jgi:hypothetical protein
VAVEARVSDLKKQLEHLFPGKWLRGDEKSRNLQTGMSEIDGGICRGIARKRITEWVGSVSSGKTSLLRAAITNWCTAGLNVAYIDANGQLFAADWAFIDNGSTTGKFWIVRPPDKDTISIDKSKTVVPLVSKQHLYAQEAIWSADQFVRSNAFDVVILDLGALDLGSSKRRGMVYTGVPSRTYARLQRSLDKSKAALIITRDTVPGAAAGDSWGCWARFNFDWSAEVTRENGLAGTVMITPNIRCNIVKDGMSQTVEVKLGCSVQNRLFTHPQVPDRRTSKR